MNKPQGILILVTPPPPAERMEGLQRLVDDSQRYWRVKPGTHHDEQVKQPNRAARRRADANKRRRP